MKIFQVVNQSCGGITLKVYKRNKQSGFSTTFALVLLALSGIAGVMVFKSIESAKQRSQIEIDENFAAVLISSAAETLLPALDLAESKYLEMVTNCDPARSFLEALNKGHNCASLGAIKVFNTNDVSVLDAAEQALFQYLGEWTINNNSVTAASQNGVVRIPLAAPYAVEFYLDGVIPESSWIIMNAVILKNGVRSNSKKVSFTLRTPDYQLHVESANNSITQELQNPQNKCLNGEWTEFKTFRGGSCSPLDAVGGVKGLAFFRDHYFGLNNISGIVVDLGAPGPGSNQVLENGTLGGIPVFPAYRRENLLSVDDIEVIDGDSGNGQIYYVGGTAMGVHIGYTDYATNANYPVCNLGAMGWAQSYSGMTASSGSSRLIPTNPLLPSVTIANFLLKTDTGVLLNVRVRSQKTGVTYSGSLPPESKITDATWNRTFICTVKKITEIPSPEYLRTMGMTQSTSNRKRFSIL